MFFDLDTLVSESQGNSQLMLTMLENFYYKKIPKNKWDRKNFSSKSLSGKSYLLSPQKLFSARVDVNYKVQFILLAGRRDYLHYRMYKATYLDLSYFPDLDLSKIRGNPLMEVIQNKLYFKE